MKFSFIFLLFVGFSLVAQDGERWEIIMDSDANQSADISKKLQDIMVGDHLYIRKTKPVDANFSGYAIELLASDFPIEISHPILKSFGKIYEDRIDLSYSYMIQYPNNNRKGLRKFFLQNIKPDYPNAKVVRYLEGHRTTVLKW